jgi:hypothetical protein
MSRNIKINILTVILLFTMSFSVSSAQNCNYNGMCEPGEDQENCVYDCLISTLHKNIKIQNATYNITKAIHYKLDGSKQIINDIETIKNIIIDKVDFSVLGVIGTDGKYKLQDLTDDIPVVGYRDTAHCDPNYITPAEWQEYNQHEEWFAHQSNKSISQQNRIYRKYFPYVAYLYNPTSPWIEKYTDFTKLYLESQTGSDGVFLDDTYGWVNSSLYVWQKNEEQEIQEATYLDENDKSFSYKHIDTNEPIYSYTNFPAIVSSLADPTLIYDNIGIWGEMHRIYFDYSTPVSAGTKVNVSYYTDATIPREIQDSWKQRMIEMLSKTREKIGGELIIYNGFAITRDYDNDFLQFADGGMFEGLFHNGWTLINENISEGYWKQQVDKLFDISHTKKKIFLAQTNAVIDGNSTEDQIQKLAMFSFASFLLGKGDYAYYGFNVFPNDGQSAQFIYFDYWETNIGEALGMYHLRETIGGVNIYEREFNNVLVLVNPGEITATVNLGAPFCTLTGGIVNSVTLEPKSGIILYKFGAVTTTTVQPITTTTSSVIKSLNLTAPNGGESWKRNAMQNITWSTSGTLGTLKLTLWQNGALINTVAENVNPSSGSYRWSTGAYTGGVAPLGTGYKIKIEEQGSGLNDDSNGPFSIVKLNVIAPNGGESWQIGTTHNITWVAKSISGNLRIVLLKDEVKIGNIVNSISPGLSSYAWTVGSYVGGTTTAGTGYQIQVREIGTEAGDRSDALFTLSAP